MLFSRKSAILVILLKIQVALGVATYTSDRLVLTKDTRFRPLVVKNFDQLIYVSFPASSAPKIKFESEKINYELCELDFASINEIEYPVNLDVLANGKLVLSLLGLDSYMNHYVLTYVVNLENCEFVTVVTAVNTSTVAEREQLDSIAVIAGEQEFDIFLAEHTNCSIGRACRLRYNETGEFVQATDLELPENAISWSLNLVAKNDFSQGYFHMVFRVNDTIMQRLNEDLQVEDEKQLEKVFVYSSDYGNVNVCRGITSSKLECELFNVEFRSRATAILDAEPYKNFVRNIKVFNLPDGSAMVLFVLQIYTTTPASAFSTYLYHVNLYGSESNPVKFQDDICKDFDRVVVSKMRQDFFCFSFSCRESILTKCIVF